MLKNKYLRVHRQSIIAMFCAKESLSTNGG
jgi:hypothetical protein